MNVLGRELYAILSQGQLIARGLLRRAEPAEGPRVAVFVHGVLAAGPVFDPMRARVARTTGLSTLDFTYSPLSTFEAIVARFETCIERRVPPGARLCLVGHSLGGLVVRWYAQELDRFGRVERLVTLATPHAGTLNARFAPVPAASALYPDSPVIKRLEASRSRAVHIPHTTIVAGGDRLIAPLTSATSIEGAAVEWVPGVGHNEMLFEPGVHDLVVRSLLRG